MRENLALRQQLREYFVHACGLIGKLVLPSSGESPNDRVVLQQREIHWRRRNLAAGEADRHQPPTSLHQPRHLLKYCAADVVKANVHTISACRVRRSLSAANHPLEAVLSIQPAPGVRRAETSE